MPLKFKEQTLEIGLQILLDVLTKGESTVTPPGDLVRNSDFQEILAHLSEIRLFVLAISNGDLSQTMRTKGPIVGSLKNLQASLRHLTWQTQKIAEGDFSQRVAFLGEFSNSFNQMAIKLEETRSHQMEIDNTIRESEENFRQILELFTDGFFLVDEQGLIVGWNQSQEQITGLARQDAIGKPAWEVQWRSMQPELKKQYSIAVIEQMIRTALQTGSLPTANQAVESIIYAPDGTRRITQQMSFLIKTPHGYRIASVLRDITKQRETDEAIRQSEQRYRLLVQLLPDGVLVHRNATIVFANSTCASLLGFEHPDDLNGVNVLDLVHPDSRLGAQERITQILEEGKPALQVEEKFIRQDGVVIDIELAASPFTFEGSQAVQTVIRDITARKKTEASIGEQVRFEKLLSGLSAALVSSTTTGVEKVIEQGLERIAEFLDVDRVSLSNYLPERHELRVVSEYNRPKINPRAFPLKQDACPWFFENFFQGKSIILEKIQDFPSEASSERQIMLELKIKSFLAIPVTSSEGILGGLYIANYRREHIWPEEIVARIQLLAEIFINVLARNRAQKAEREQRKLAEALRDSAGAFNRTANIDQVFDCILEHAGRVIPHDAANIMLLDEYETAHIVRNKGYEPWGWIDQSTRIAIKKMPFLKKMADTAEPVIVETTVNEPDWVPIQQMSWVRSYAAMPIMYRDQVMGFINLDSTVSGCFTQDHATRLHAFADQAAIAYANARLVQDLHDAFDNKQAQLAENEKLRAELLEQTIRDPLTGLFNRRYLTETLEREIAQANREFAPVSIIVMDLDHFKLVNDTYGHQAGDLLLQALGKLLKTNTRVGDIACRYGGEEFVVVMPGSAAPGAIQRAESIRATFDALYIKDGDRILHATLSLGVATYPTQGSTGEDVLIRADRALYQAKQNGRNRVVSYTGTAPLILPKSDR